MESHSSDLVCNQLKKCKAILSPWATQTQGWGAFDLRGPWKQRARAGKTSRSHPSRTHFQDLPVCFVQSGTGGRIFLLFHVCTFLLFHGLGFHRCVHCNTCCTRSWENVQLVGLDTFISWQYLQRSSEGCIGLARDGPLVQQPPPPPPRPHLVPSDPWMALDGFRVSGTHDCLCDPLRIWVCLKVL